MSHAPDPINADDVELSQELDAALTERLAENAHGRWAEARLDQGWTLGDARDYARKFHPLLPDSIRSIGREMRRNWTALPFSERLMANLAPGGKRYTARTSQNVGHRLAP